MISAFDIFKPGIGPSSSHTVGPMNAGKRFIDQLVNMGDIAHITRIVVDLYGSLSLTGKGHATDVAIVMGLAGNSPQNVDIDAMPAFIQQVMHSGRLPIANGVLTTENDDQAIARMREKGADCARAAVEMANLLRAIAEINACDNQFSPEWIEPFNRVIRRTLEA